jgi:Flp pilus assembly protein TadD
MLDAEGRELARFYAFPPGEDAAEDESGQWAALTPAGFYDASSGGASLLVVKTQNKTFSLNQFSEVLFRPDVTGAVLRGEKAEAGEGLGSLLRRENRPPALAFSGRPSAAADGAAALKLTVTDEGGGVGTLVVFRRDRLGDVPLAFYDPEKITLRKYQEKGRDRLEVEIKVPPEAGTGSVGVSVFNRERTAESERLWAETGSWEAAPVSGEKPVLHIVALDSSALGEYFSRQAEGSLYSKAIIHKLDPGESGAKGFSRLIDSFSPGLGGEDVVVFCLPGPAGFDAQGDWRFSFGGGADPEEENTGKWELLENTLKLRNRSVLILLDGPGNPPPEASRTETGFARLRQWLGGRAVLAVLPGASFSGEALRNLPAGKPQYLSAGDFMGAIQEAAGEPAPGGLASLPVEDFLFLDRLPDFGEIRMQAMASGSVTIDGFDTESRPLGFGETLVRKVPAGRYSVSMVYRNGRWETKEVDVRSRGSSWAVFTYVPDLLAGDLRGGLPLFGVNVAELNPANFQKHDPVTLRTMEIPAWQLAFLSGEDLYKKGNYDKAIAEYSRSISLKSDYTGAYVSRGNAYRKQGDVARAVDDYTRALRQKADYAEVYNYRGYLYSQQGDFARAIADYTQAVKFRGNYADAYFNRACAYSEQKDWDKAIADYTQVIKIEPSNATAYNERGNAWHYKEDYDRAIADYTQALKLKPGYALAYRSRGNAWYSKGDREKAEADYAAAGPGLR